LRILNTVGGGTRLEERDLLGDFSFF
jgi:hypothetical protein